MSDLHADPPFHARVQGTLLGLCLILSALSAASPGMAKSAADAQEEGLRFYQSGRVNDSIKTFEDQLDQSGTPEDQATWLSWLVTICTEAREFACLERSVPRTLDLMSQYK